MKIRFITKWLAIIIVITLVLVVSVFLVGYVKKYLDLEKGIVINKLDYKDTAILCSYFNIGKNEDISPNFLEYQQGFKHVYVKLYVKANHSHINHILENYVDSNINYYLDDSFCINDNYTEYKQFVNANNLKKYAFVFYYENDVTIVFYSFESDNSITNLIEDKMLY